jgi:rod shape-determining protein MreD
MSRSRHGYGIIALSILIAILLTILPLPTWANYARPLWVLMVMAYWALAFDNKVSVGMAFGLGILQDILSGTLFGEHAVALIICVFIVCKLRKQIRFFPVLQQAIVIALLSVIYQLIIFIIQLMLGEVLAGLYWLSILTTAIFWPWTFIILRDIRRRFNII